MQYLKHYWVRDGKFLTEPGQNGPLQSHPTQFVKGPLRVQFWLQDDRGVDYCLSTTDDSSLVTEVDPGLKIIQKSEWDAIVATIPEPEPETNLIMEEKVEDWDKFEIIVLQSKEMKDFVSFVAHENPLISSAFPASFYEAKNGKYNSFKIVWNELVKISPVDSSVAASIIAVAKSCNLPKEFISIIEG